MRTVDSTYALEPVIRIDPRRVRLQHHPAQLKEQKDDTILMDMMRPADPYGADGNGILEVPVRISKPAACRY